MAPKPAGGARLGPYELIARIGKGGMGEVWSAHDSRLGREVAIKLSADQFSDRFEREARAIAALNHPNICTIYDVGPNYLVMELIDGPTLADKIAEGPIPIDESLAIAKQIADALEAAHEKNIVHRDLKPGNIKVRPDGSVKVLDFGLAKAGLPESVVTHDSPTMLLHSPTQVGVILGTAAYMAPEQARGKTVDKRADIWSFGVVLCEMITGTRLFEGEDLTDTLAAVVKSDPNLAPVPQRIRRLISKCLQKDPKKRLRDIGDVWELLSEDPIATAPATQPESERRASILWPVATGLLALIAAAVSFLHFREKPAPPPTAMRFQIHLPEGVKFESAGTLVLSPDGRHAAFPANDNRGAAHIFVQDLDGGLARELSSTGISAASPPAFWSPDSAFIAYSGGLTLDRVEIATGLVQPICDKPGPVIGGSWSRKGVIIFGSTNAGLWRVQASGGKPVPITKLDTSRKEVAHQLPEFLPDGRHYIFLATSADSSQSGIFARSLDDAPEKPSALIASTEFGGVFVPDAEGNSGWLLWLHGALTAQRIDGDRLRLTGDPVSLPASIGTAYKTALFSASPEVMVYRSGGAKRVVQFEWIDAKTGKSAGKIGDPGVIIAPIMSPDEKRVAYAKEGDDGIQDIWILDVERGASSRLTLGGTSHSNPLWSPDGSELIYSELVDGMWRLVRRRVDGTSGEEPVLSLHGKSLIAEDWSRDGRFLIMAESTTPGFVHTSLDVLPLGAGTNAKDATPVAFSPPASFSEDWGAFSPDGHFVAYSSFETGRSEIYVRTFAQNPGGQPLGKWIVSKDGGRSPEWRDGGKRLVWFHNSGVWNASVDLSHGFHAGQPELLYPIPNALGGATLYSSKGQGLVLNPMSQLMDEPINVLVNWKSTLHTTPSVK